MLHLPLLLCLLLLLPLEGRSVPAPQLVLQEGVTWYISPSGNDAWGGTIEGTLAAPTKRYGTWSGHSHSM
jgi:hypothetical protein